MESNWKIIDDLNVFWRTKDRIGDEKSILWVEKGNLLYIKRNGQQNSVFRCKRYITGLNMVFFAKWLQSSKWMSLFPLFIHDLLKWTELLFLSYFLSQMLSCCCRILFTRMNTICSIPVFSFGRLILVCANGELYVCFFKGSFCSI